MRQVQLVEQISGRHETHLTYVYVTGIFGLVIIIIISQDAVTSGDFALQNDFAITVSAMFISVVISFIQPWVLSKKDYDYPW